MLSLQIHHLKNPKAYSRRQTIPPSPPSYITMNGTFLDWAQRTGGTWWLVLMYVSHFVCSLSGERVIGWRVFIIDEEDRVGDGDHQDDYWEGSFFLSRVFCLRACLHGAILENDQGEESSVLVYLTILYVLQASWCRPEALYWDWDSNEGGEAVIGSVTACNKVV